MTQSHAHVEPMATREPVVPRGGDTAAAAVEERALDAAVQLTAIANQVRRGSRIADALPEMLDQWALDVRQLPSAPSRAPEGGWTPSLVARQMRDTADWVRRHRGGLPDDLDGAIGMWVDTIEAWLDV